MDFSKLFVREQFRITNTKLIPYVNGKLKVNIFMMSYWFVFAKQTILRAKISYFNIYKYGQVVIYILTHLYGIQIVVKTRSYLNGKQSNHTKNETKIIVSVTS